MGATPEQAAHYVSQLEQLTAQLDAERAQALQVAQDELIRTALEMERALPEVFATYRAGIDWSIGCLAAAQAALVGAL
jgi:hypothetical protein